MARALVAVALTGGVLADAPAAMGNAASPTASPMLPGSVVINANGTVSVTAAGTWIWVFGRESPITQGLDATTRHPCDSRTGVGWGVVWNDPNDPGFAESYHTNNRNPPVSYTVHVGSRGYYPVNSDDQVEYNASHPCGTFHQTNNPGPGDGYDAGTWSETHVYKNVASLPKFVCVITYDLGLAKPPGPHRISFGNNDNSVQWGLYNAGYWNTLAMGQNCEALVAPVSAPTTTVTTTARTVSHTTPTTIRPAAVTKPSGALAFTGFGPDGRLLVLFGLLFILAGGGIYLGWRRRDELRNLITWLIGW